MSLQFNTLYSDTFTGANQDPLLDGGNWTTDPNQGSHALRIVSQQCIAATFGSGGSYYSGGLRGNDRGEFHEGRLWALFWAKTSYLSSAIRPSVSSPVEIDFMRRI